MLTHSGEVNIDRKGFEPATKRRQSAYVVDTHILLSPEIITAVINHSMDKCISDIFEKFKEKPLDKPVVRYYNISRYI